MGLVQVVPMSSRETDLYLGCDGGGSGSRVALATARAEVVARATSGPANVSTDFDDAVETIRNLIEDVCTKAGISPSSRSIQGVHLGLAGVLNRHIAGRVQRAIGLPCARVTEDVETTTVGALGGRDGSVVAIGTGSFVAVSRQGEILKVGGWGYMAGDQASGAWLGQNVLRMALLAYDGILDPSPMLEQIVAEHDHNPTRISEFSLQATPVQFARLGGRVIQAAVRNDRAAKSILERGARYIDSALVAAGHRAGNRICLVGGLGPHYAAHIDRQLLEGLTRPDGDALDGALLLATRRDLDIRREWLPGPGC